MIDLPVGGVPSRRKFLGLLGTGAAVAAGGGALSGCSSGGGGTGTEGRAEVEGKLAGLLPAYIAYEAVKPDLPGENGSSPGFLKYPSELKRAVPNKPVTSGKEVTAMTPLWGPAPPGLGSNSYFDANNERIGAPVRFNIVDGAAYLDKLGPLLAAGNVPELTVMMGWMASNITRFSQAADKLFEDLTPYLAGDKAKEFPMLANLPTRAWAYGVWNNQLKAVPYPGTGIPWALFYRKDLFDQHGVQAPKNMDDVLALGKQLTDAKVNRWAFGAMVPEVARAFRAPAGWHKDSAGNLKHQIETTEYEESVAFNRRLFQSGYVHPTVIANPSADVKPLFEGGQVLMYQDGPGSWAEALQRQLPINPKFNMQAVLPFAHDGGEPIVWKGEPAGIFTFVKKGLGEARIKELLGVLNYTASPFGTEEAVMCAYGQEGKHYVKEASGAPKLTALGAKEVANTYIFLGGRPAVISESQYPGYVEAMHAWEKACVKYAQEKPFEGIRVEQPSKLAALSQPFDDKVQDILRGRRPVSDLKVALAEWRKNGGDEGREFFAKVLTDNGR
ncbi:extracellular solute-binding protein [Kribbella albertanoniae]|uniref:extracellular solute-binding protein n=1 Tax=Kribbella albertanoniae TaxID=1266829 RepID=UPI001EDEE913|nr:extracellular solute-binding protein [Kribbella albertanoniae]